jgi:hypothetical protein
MKLFVESRNGVGSQPWIDLYGGVAGEIVISPIIRRDFPSCYDSVMRDLVVLFIHFIATLARWLGPGGARSFVADSLLLVWSSSLLNPWWSPHWTKFFPRFSS